MYRLENRIYRFIRFFFLEIAVRVLCIVWVRSHSFGVKIVHRLCFWFPHSIRNVLKNFQNCSQPDQLVGELDQPVCRVL